jgi:hypoxanthine phosphoribosyltransferase
MSEKKLVIAVTEEEIKAAIVAKANEYKEIFTGSKLIIISELSGVFVFLADFIRELPLDVLIQFVAFDQTDGKKNITLDLDTKTSIKDENVLILTDVYNKGNSLSRPLWSC